MPNNIELSLCEAQQSSRRLGLEITLGGVSARETSSVWTVAGWKIQFIRLQPDQAVALDQSQGSVYLKVICGALVDPELTPFGAAKEVRSTLITDSRVKAGQLGAIFALFTETNAVADNIHSMDQLAFDGTEIAYVHFWTMGKGADASAHDHSQSPSAQAPAFTEIHWVFNNGSGLGGMYECDAIEGERTRTVMQRGEEHGPFWRFDAATGIPIIRPNGAVEYGLHGWQGGNDDDTQAFDFIAAFEINPHLNPHLNPQEGIQT